MWTGIKTITKEVMDIFKLKSPFVVLAILVTFHATILLGNYSVALEQVFSFMYAPENSNIIALVRNFLAYFSLTSWVYLWGLVIAEIKPQ
jgi:hypothetical protein